MLALSLSVCVCVFRSVLAFVQTRDKSRQLVYCIDYAYKTLLGFLCGNKPLDGYELTE